MDKILALLNSMGGYEINNYIVPGLRSTILADHGGKGRVRLFSADREQLACVTPHSHRFKLASCVLNGQVTNEIWRACSSSVGDHFKEVEQKYEGVPGKYTFNSKGQNHYKKYSEVYMRNSWYYMDEDVIHSIVFEKGARVLVIEGPNLRDTSLILQPVVDGEMIELNKTDDWMFKNVVK